MDDATLRNEITDLREAQWEVFEELAKGAPDGCVLAIHMFRTRTGETIAVLTVAEGGEPVQSVVRGDSDGLVDVNDCVFADDSLANTQRPVETLTFSPGGPPPHQPPTPGAIASAADGLQMYFGPPAAPAAAVAAPLSRIG